MRKLKDKVASGLGSVLEWYDFALYGFFSPLIAQLYFPSLTSNIALLKTFSVFAVGFFARPFGGLIFGYISDTYGRTKSLKLTPLLITLPTVCLSLLPTHQQIGVIAPILFVLLRICQGICIGGEYANNIVYLCESTKAKHIYFLGSMGACAGSLGIALASSIATLCYKIFPLPFLLSWGWRLAFSFSFILGVIAYVMRKNMLETPVFQNVLRNHKNVSNPIFESYRTQWKDYIIAMGLTFFPATSFYYLFMFLPNFLNNVLKYNTSQILSENSKALFLRILIIPMMGLIADQVGGLYLLRLSCTLFFILSYPILFYAIHNSSYISLCIYAFAVLSTFSAASTSGLLIELLKPETRCTIFAFTFNFSFGVFGGLTPCISLFLNTYFMNQMTSIYYLMCTAIITFIATFFFKRAQSYDYA